MAAAGKAGLRLVMMNTGFGATQFVEVAEREKAQRHPLRRGVCNPRRRVARASAARPHLGRRRRPEGVLTLDAIAATGDTTAPAEPDAAAGLVILTSGTHRAAEGATCGAMSPFASVLLLDRIPFPAREHR